MNVIPKEITVQLKHLEVTGTAMIQMWGGDIGFIEMTPVILGLEPEVICKTTEFVIKEAVRQNLNDGGFGCEYILGAHVAVKAVYSNGAKYPVDEFYTARYGDMTLEHLTKFQEYEAAE